MPKITFHGEKAVETPAGKTILETSLGAGIQHTHVCGGNARCSTCRVFILDGLENCLERNEKEKVLAASRKFDPMIRLACQTKIAGDVTCKRLVKDEDDIALLSQELGADHTCTGQEKRLAIFFSDLRGFTTFSEGNLPYDVVHVLNKYFTKVCPLVISNKGFIDKYIGDGLMAIFGLEDDPNPVFSAVKSAIEQLEELKKLNVHLKTNYGVELKMGIGIHYGDVIIGNMGYPKKASFTAIGDTVNTAARIESANKQAGTELLVSEDAYQMVKDRVIAGKIHEVDLKGKEGKFKLYEIIGLK